MSEVTSVPTLSLFSSLQKKEQLNCVEQREVLKIRILPVFLYADLMMMMCVSVVGGQ